MKYSTYFLHFNMAFIFSRLLSWLQSKIEFFILFFARYHPHFSLLKGWGMKLCKNWSTCQSSLSTFRDFLWKNHIGYHIKYFLTIPGIFHVERCRTDFVVRGWDSSRIYNRKLKYFIQYSFIGRYAGNSLYPSRIEWMEFLSL